MVTRHTLVVLVLFLSVLVRLCMTGITEVFSLLRSILLGLLLVGLLSVVSLH